MYELARQISPNIQVVGRRLGERLNETLISANEIPYTYLDDNYILIKLVKIQ